MDSPVSLEGVTLHVKDVEASLQFYQKVPGAQVLVHRPGQFALLRLGACRLGLLRDDSLAFHLEADVTDVDAMYEQVLSLGMRAEGPPQNKPWGGRDFYVHDPDGNIIEFSGK